MGKRPSVGAVQHLEARQEMLKNQLDDMENRIYGRNNSFLPFITNKNGSISERKLNNFIKSLINGVYKSGMHDFITNEKFKELCECFLYCAVQGIAEYDEKERYIVRSACCFYDIVNIARHKNNLLFGEENTLHKYEFETAWYDEAEDDFIPAFINEFQWGGFLRYSDIAFRILTDKSITDTFTKEEYRRLHDAFMLEEARNFGFDTAEEHQKWVQGCEELEKDLDFLNQPQYEEYEWDFCRDEVTAELSEKRKCKNDEWRKNVSSPEEFVKKYLRFRELFFELDLYYRYNLFEYAEFMVDLFLYNNGLSSISEDESFAMIYYRTNKLCASVKHEAARRDKK